MLPLVVDFRKVGKMSTFEALGQVRKQHARSQRDRVPKTAPEAVRARAHARVEKLEKQVVHCAGRPRAPGR